VGERQPTTNHLPGTLTRTRYSTRSHFVSTRVRQSYPALPAHSDFPWGKPLCARLHEGEPPLCALLTATPLRDRDRLLGAWSHRAGSPTTNNQQPSGYSTRSPAGVYMGETPFGARWLTNNQPTQDLWELHP
jgi:hypothetical protein